MGTVHIPTLLEGILEATAAEAAAKARIATLRAVLEDEARRRYTDEGAAPAWNTPALGKVRLDPPGDWTASVADPAAFGSYVAQHFPTEATAIIPVPAADLEDVLTALGFIGVAPAGEVRVEVRSAWEEDYLAGLAVNVETTDDGRTITVADPTTGVLVDGLTATSKPARLVVSLDRDRRTAAINEARATAEAIVADAAATPAPDADLADLDARRRDLEGLHGDQLAAIAKAHGLGSSGTKAALAERIARAEAATGNVIRPASTVVDVRFPQVEPDSPLPVGDNAPGPGPFTDETGAPVEQEPGAYAPGGAVANAIADEVRRAQDAEPVEQPVEEVPDGGDVADTMPAAPLSAVSREVLRKLARSHGVNPGGTKAELIDRLLAAGITTVITEEA